MCVDITDYDTGRKLEASGHGGGRPCGGSSTAQILVAAGVEDGHCHGDAFLPNANQHVNTHSHTAAITHADQERPRG